MKRRTIITSVLVIVLCLGLISGSTFALFTSESSVNIAVTSGKVNIDAKLGSLKLYSADATLTEGDKVDKINPLDKTGTILPTDPQGAFAGTYYYRDQTSAEEFLNGGTAKIETNTETSTQSLSIQKITPGDKVTVNVNITNKSNVAIQYRVKVNVLSGLKLYEALVVKVDGVSLKGVQKVSNWTYLDIPATEEAKILTPIPVEVYLPLDVSDEKLQDLATSMQITVEAVQGNAKTTNEVLTQEVTAVKNVEANTSTTIKDDDGLVEATIPSGAIKTGTESLTLKVKPTDSEYNIAIESATQEVMAYDVKVLVTNSDTGAIKENNQENIQVKIFIGTGLTGVKLYHNGELMDTSAYTYDSATGYITFTTNSFSEYSVVYNKDIAVEKNNTITIYTPTEDAGVYKTKEGTQVVYNEATKEFSDFGDSVARIEQTGYPTLQAAIDAANASDTVVLLKDVTTNTVITIDKNLVLDGENHKLTTINTASDARSINVGWANSNIDVTIKNITVVGPTGEYSRGLNIANSYVKLNVYNSSISAGHYAINAASAGDHLTLNVVGSNISGWAALNIWAFNSSIVIDDSVLTGTNDKGESSWNNFATICFESNTTYSDDTHSWNNSVLITNSTINAVATNSNKQAIVSFNGGTIGATNCLLTTENCTFNSTGKTAYFNGGSGNSWINDSKEVLVTATADLSQLTIAEDGYNASGTVKFTVNEKTVSFSIADAKETSEWTSEDETTGKDYIFDYNTGFLTITLDLDLWSGYAAGYALYSNASFSE